MMFNYDPARMLLVPAVLAFMVGGAHAQDAMFVDSSGNVGIGTNSPSAALDVNRSNAQIFVLDSNSAVGSRNLFRLSNNGAAAFEFINRDIGVIWEFKLNTAGGFVVKDTSDSAAEFLVFQNGDARHSGEVTATNFNTSSSNSMKERVSSLDQAVVLEKLDQLEVGEWSYKDRPGTRHVGPMAEQFYEIFGLGPDNKHVTTTDLAGVALAAAKALKDQNDELRAENEELRARLDAIEAKMSR